MPASASMEIKPIKNTRDYQRALREIEGLMHAKRKTPEGDRLDVLVCPRRGLGGKTLANRDPYDATSYVSTISRIQAAFETAGVVFIDDDGSAGFGVRLAKTKKKRKR